MPYENALVIKHESKHVWLWSMHRAQHWYWRHYCWSADLSGHSEYNQESQRRCDWGDPESSQWWTGSHSWKHSEADIWEHGMHLITCHFILSYFVSLKMLMLIADVYLLRWIESSMMLVTRLAHQPRSLWLNITTWRRWWLQDPRAPISTSLRYLHHFDKIHYFIMFLACKTFSWVAWQIFCWVLDVLKCHVHYAL